MSATEYSSTKMASKHYENFPIASFLIPKEIRQAIYNIYAFARTADDIADDINLASEEKLEQLTNFELELDKIEESKNLIFIALNTSIKKHNLTKKYFFDLLKAFKQDCTLTSYKSFIELINYSKYSANPVGRLMLELANYNDEKLNLLSDKICTGLQLINFWQDLSLDKKMKRYYIPSDILVAQDLDIERFYYGNERAKQALVLEELFQKTEKLYSEGYELISHLKGLFKYEIKLIWCSANHVFMKTKRLKSKLLYRRPMRTKLNSSIQILSNLLFRK